MKAAKAKEKRSLFGRFLNGVERAGNRLPHPITLFAIFTLAVILLSALCAWLGVSATGEVINSQTMELEEQTVEAVSLLSREGVVYMLTSMVKNFTGFAPLGVVLVTMLGVGCAEGSGYLSAVLIKLVKITPRVIVTPMLVFLGVMSNIATDIGYVLLIPIGALVFLAYGRHPLAGLAAAFAGVSGGFSANLLIGALDPLLAGITTEAAGIIAPGYTPEALEILKTKRKGGYNVVKIDPDYQPAPVEQKDVYGITFEQGRNEMAIDGRMLETIVTRHKELPEAARRDLILSLITLKYTQSNSVCYVKDGQAIGVGAGQQSRIHCTRLAGNKADTWWLRHHPKVLALQFVEGIRRPDRDNAIDIYLSDECDDLLSEGVWQQTFTVKPEPLTAEEKKGWISTLSGVTCGSDAFFPFGDNVERARKSGVQYIAEPGGSIRDDHVIATADQYGMTMCFTGMRLFHH